MSKIFRIKISDSRAISVHEDIARGSEPKLRFYAMVAASTILATLGLVMNSTAVVIGAMLVAPLMTPIFGVALALVRGDASLLGRALRAEIAGVFLAVFLAACFGFIMPEQHVTHEMLSRTKPNLFDLLVAVFAGFAGAYAMVDEHISPALPGVAIATAIVPPLANTGLCIALGSNYGAVGSFMLFFANFLSILLVASAVFFAAGMEREFGAITSRDIFRRFSLATIGFLIVAVVLSKGLFDMVQERRLKGSITNVLTEELSHLTASDLEEVVYRRYKDKIYCLAHVHASGYITPYRVKLMEKELEKKLDQPVELFVRSTLSKDVSATGSTNQVITETLDGFFIGRESDPKIDLIKTAEQTIREYLDNKPSLHVQHVNLMPLSGKKVILATLTGPKSLSSEEIGMLESDIQDRSGEEKVLLTIRHIDLNLSDRFGTIYYEWMSLEDWSSEQFAAIESIKFFLTAEFAKSEYSIVDYTFTIRDGVYHIMLELAGTRLYSPDEFALLRKKLANFTKDPVEIYVRSRPEVVLTENGYTSFRKLQDKFLEQAESLYEKEMKNLLEGAL